MPFADQRAGRAEITLWISANQKLRDIDGDRLPLHLARREHYETQFHNPTSLPSETPILLDERKIQTSPAPSDPLGQERRIIAMLRCRGHRIFVTGVDARINRSDALYPRRRSRCRAVMIKTAMTRAAKAL